tara:strand:+ start:12038 stop:12628 length:591 start_codon:yes stop_codon:yes gene_type:complete
MGSQLTIKELKGGKVKEQLKQNKTQTTIDGQSVDTQTEPQKHILLIGAKKTGIDLNHGTPLNEAAKILLGTVCSISTQGKDYSLITTCGDTEPIDNENIIDMALYDATKSEPTNLDDKFSNVDDPIFNLDDDIPHGYVEYNKTQAAAAEPDYIYFTADVLKSVLGNGASNGGGSSQSAAASSRTTTTTTTMTTTGY